MGKIPKCLVRVTRSLAVSTVVAKLLEECMVPTVSEAIHCWTVLCLAVCLEEVRQDISQLQTSSSLRSLERPQFPSFDSVVLNWLVETCFNHLVWTCDQQWRSE